MPYRRHGLSNPGLRVAATVGLAFLEGALPVPAQSIRVYSEFQRIDPFGDVVSVDRPRRPDAHPREILSPAVARNAFSSYHVAVTAPAGREFTVYAGQNPEDYFQITLYKEVYIKLGDSWIPDGLEQIQLPYKMTLPDPSQSIPGQTTASFWMDAWVRYDAEVGRVKLEPQIYVDGRWVSYPMEVRVMPAVVESPPAPSTFLGAVQEPSDSSVRGVLRGYLCGGERRDPGRAPGVRFFILRNALQDVALAQSLESSHGPDVLSRLARKFAGSSGSRALCEAPAYPSGSGPEWYLKVRDALHRMVN